MAWQWVTGITGITPHATKIASLVRNGRAAAQRLLPPERLYPVPPAIASLIRADAPGALPVRGVPGETGGFAHTEGFSALNPGVVATGE